MESANQQIRVFKKTLLLSFLTFLIICAVGMGLGLAHNRKLNKIEQDCGFHTNCVRLYSQHHLGATRYAAVVFNIGIVGTGVSGVALLVALFSARRRN